MYSFNDMGDTGDYLGCLALPEHATYNYINVNITKLPVDIRSGLCFPKECTQAMMDQAQDPIAVFFKNLVKIFLSVGPLEFLKKYEIGFVMSFIQPKTWREEQHQKKSTGSVIVLLIIAIFSV